MAFFTPRGHYFWAIGMILGSIFSVHGWWCPCWYPTCRSSSRKIVIRIRWEETSQPQPDYWPCLFLPIQPCLNLQQGYDNFSLLLGIHMSDYTTFPCPFSSVHGGAQSVHSNFSRWVDRPWPHVAGLSSKEFFESDQEKRQSLNLIIGESCTNLDDLVWSIQLNLL